MLLFALYSRVNVSINFLKIQFSQTTPDRWIVFYKRYISLARFVSTRYKAQSTCKFSCTNPTEMSGSQWKGLWARGFACQRFKLQSLLSFAQGSQMEGDLKGLGLIIWRPVASQSRQYWIIWNNDMRQYSNVFCNRTSQGIGPYVTTHLDADSKELYKQDPAMLSISQHLVLAYLYK